jgi:hypothetical protein
MRNLHSTGVLTVRRCKDNYLLLIIVDINKLLMMIINIMIYLVDIQGFLHNPHNCLY